MAPSNICLQQDFINSVCSTARGPSKKKRIILKIHPERLLDFLNNHHLNLNFEIWGQPFLSLVARDTEVLQTLLYHKKVDVNLRFHDGRTCLFAAVTATQTESLRLLIHNGAIINQKDNEGCSPLALAAKLGHYDHAKILVEANADISSTDEQMHTPITRAILSQSNEVLEYLLSKTVGTPTWHYCHGRSPLITAVEAGNVQGMRLLIRTKTSGELFTESERSLLIWAIIRRDLDMVQVLLEADPSLVSQRVEGRTPLSVAAETGDAGVMSQLIDAGADPNAADEKSWPPLSKLTFKNRIPDQSILPGVDNDASSHIGTCQAPIHLTARLGHQEGLKLLQFVADVNLKDSQGRTALAWAVKKSHLKTVETLLNAQGVEVDCHDVHGQTPFVMAARLGEMTPLAWAVKERQKGVVELLLDLPGIGVDQPNNEGRTPFSLAAELGLIPIMQLLLNKQADPHKADHHGNNAFWWIFKWRERPESRLITPTGGNPFQFHILVNNLPEHNKKDQSGRNWLSWAACYGDAEIVGYLLQCEAVDANIRDDAQDSFSRTPLIWALERGEETIIDLLKEHDNISLHLLVQEARSTWGDRALQLIRALIHAKYNVNHRDFKGRTPLHLACLESDEDVVVDIINAGAEINCKDHAGKIPLQYALGARCKRSIRSLLNAPSADLKPVTSDEWFKFYDFESKKATCIQITKRANTSGFDIELINDTSGNWLPGPKESRLCICKKRSFQTQLPKYFQLSGSLKGQTEYFGHFHKDFEQSTVTYLCLKFPEDHRGKAIYPWGIAWGSKQTTEGSAHGFISTLRNGWMPDNPFEFFQQFVDHLHRKWNKSCSRFAVRVEKLRGDQVNARGGNPGLIDHLAQASKSRAQLSKCLQSHINGINDVITGNTSFDLEQKSQLAADMETFEKRLTAKLSHSEQSIRELLQIELAWVSTNESASVKRLSWLTFVFLPPMFVSSLFGMNINLPENNPDWRWYILWGTLSFVVTGALWLVSKLLAKGLGMNYARGVVFPRRSHASAC
ncbi:ankyrin repeat-containing domain protein [Aspergillus taichungensis]|uniref:Ankyrin repeat-containing domain protein n=1 Tax=Aspergillus taichungensis TaxID=482145 RepID=A0A2J5HQ41_9EURO|nr:ankyrin repeat-containing domain protein [Aspergillus taichungensis]